MMNLRLLLSENEEKEFLELFQRCDKNNKGVLKKLLVKRIINLLDQTPHLVTKDEYNETDFLDLIGLLVLNNLKKKSISHLDFRQLFKNIINRNPADQNKMPKLLDFMLRQKPDPLPGDQVIHLIGQIIPIPDQDDYS